MIVEPVVTWSCGRGISNESKIDDVIAPWGESPPLGLGGGASNESKIDDSILLLLPVGALGMGLGGGASKESKIEDCISPFPVAEIVVGWGRASKDLILKDSTPASTLIGAGFFGGADGASNESKIELLISSGGRFGGASNASKIEGVTGALA